MVTEKQQTRDLLQLRANLAGMYAKGYGVEQDYAQAMQWCRRAADQGNVGAQQQIGVMYHFGYGVPKDLLQAYFWYTLATGKSWQRCGRASSATLA